MGIVWCVVLMIVCDNVIGDLFVYLFIKDKVFINEMYW